MTPIRKLTPLLLAAFLGLRCSAGPAEEAGDVPHGAEHAPHGAEEVPRGPHGGRLFTGDDLQLELAIAEEDGPPLFVAYVSNPGGAPLPAEGAVLTVFLERFAGRHEAIPLRPVGGHLRSDQVVGEPHSFRARVDLDRAGRQYSWTYEQVEGRVNLAPEAVAASGIQVVAAGPRPIAVVVEAPGEVRLNGERLAVMRPRYPGFVTTLHARLGDGIAAGDTLALVKSSESLTDYAITAPMAGTIVSQNVTAGAVVERETVLFTLADLSGVWVDFVIYPQHVGRVRRGQRARVTATTEPPQTIEGIVTYVGPLLEQDTRVSYGRIVLPNPDGRWQPGLYVGVQVTVERVEVPVAVPEAAIVRSSFGPAVFLTDGTAFELQPVTLGRTDGEYVEVDGFPAGLRVATGNAYVLKAELGKSGATHDH